MAMKDRTTMRKAVKFKVANCNLKQTGNPIEVVKQQIFVACGQRVMLDHDLAELYGVTTKRLNQQFTRNRPRFPKDFAFQLTLAEAKEREKHGIARRQHDTLCCPAASDGFERPGPMSAGRQ